MMARSPSPKRLPPVRRVVVAGAQFAVVPNDIAANLDRCIDFLRRAVKENAAKLVVFPESITTGFNPAMPVEDFRHFLPRTEDMLAPIQNVCRELKVHCVLPTYERGPGPGVVYNSAFLLDSRGRNIGVYRKTHPFPTERLGGGGWSTPGNRYPVFPTEIGVIGIHICYDGDFPEIARILAVKGAQILCRPSALLRHFEIWEGTNKMRAYENHMYHIAVNAVGADAAGTTYFGHSMIVSPIAQTLALGRAVNDIVYAELDPDPIKHISYGSDAPMCFDHLEDRNVASYTQDLMAPARSAFQPAKRICAQKRK
ncbi:MAG: carbon-nitrogen hydrolase family protein [Verrucomicrobiota bacterium]|jgi:predicted amidohydrolase|nr:carbon-nitrogen hydrolase family protein [Verrucomicrobiota bacterium]